VDQHQPLRLGVVQVGLVVQQVGGGGRHAQRTDKRREGSVCGGANVLRAGDRSPVLRLRQGCGACTLLAVRAFCQANVCPFIFYDFSFSKINPIQRITVPTISIVITFLRSELMSFPIRKKVQ
jgi:hypothetical protein